MLVDVEFRKAITVGDADQVAPQVVVPSVIGAGQAPAIVDAVAERHASMGARVEERVELPILVAGDHHGHSGDFTGDDVAWFGDVARPRDYLRCSPKEHLPLDSKRAGSVKTDPSPTYVELPRSVVSDRMLAIIRRPISIICLEAERGLRRCPTPSRSPLAPDQSAEVALGVHAVDEGDAGSNRHHIALDPLHDP